MFTYLLCLKDGFKVSFYSFKDRSERILFSSPTYYSILHVFIKILLLVILLLYLYNRSVSVLWLL